VGVFIEAMVATISGRMAIAGTLLFSASVIGACESQEGRRVYEAACASCHEVGAHGAPRAGSNGEWAARIARGKESLYRSAIDGRTNGDRIMPPRGGERRLTDAEVRAAVDYLVDGAR
jgi:cytochrome c5